MTDNKQNGSNASSSTSDAKKWKIVDTPQDSGLIPTIAVTLWLGVNGFVLWIILYASEFLFLCITVSYKSVYILLTTYLSIINY